MASTIPGFDTACAVSGGCEVGLPESASRVTRPTVGTYWRTVRHLRGSQLAALAQRRVLRRETLRWWKSVPVVLKQVSPPAAFPEWQAPSALQAIETREFRFLSVTHPPSEYIPWSSWEFSRLWFYHLYYCDFFNVDLRSP